MHITKTLDKPFAESWKEALERQASHDCVDTMDAATKERIRSARLEQGLSDSFETIAAIDTLVASAESVAASPTATVEEVLMQLRWTVARTRDSLDKFRAKYGG